MAIDLVTMEKAGVDIEALKAALDAGNLDALLQGADKVKAFVKSEENKVKAEQAAREAANVAKATDANNTLADAMGKVLSNPKILEAFGSLAEIWPEDGKAVLININIKSRDFRISLPSAVKPAKAGKSVGSVGIPITVDGVTYVSHGAALTALSPTTKHNIGNVAIIAKLRTAGHTIG